MNQLSYEVLNTRLKKLGFVPEKSFSSGISETIDMLKGAQTLW